MWRLAVWNAGSVAGNGAYQTHRRSFCPRNMSSPSKILVRPTTRIACPLGMNDVIDATGFVVTVDSEVIYTPIVATGYEWINCCNEDDYDVFSSLDGSPRKNTWTPVRVTRVRADEHQQFLPSDFPWLASYALVM